MINTDFHTFLINFHFSSRKGEVIVSNTSASLTQLAELIRTKRNNRSFAGMDVYELDGIKWKKTTVKKFYELTNWASTDLQVVLDEIYKF